MPSNSAPWRASARRTSRTRAHGRGQWYAMQVEATNNYEVSRPISIPYGGLDRQIEHHLFPTFPPERLREIAPEVRAICERWGLACAVIGRVTADPDIRVIDSSPI